MIIVSAFVIDLWVNVNVLWPSLKPCGNLSEAFNWISLFLKLMVCKELNFNIGICHIICLSWHNFNRLTTSHNLPPNCTFSPFHMSMCLIVFSFLKLSDFICVYVRLPNPPQSPAWKLQDSIPLAVDITIPSAVIWYGHGIRLTHEWEILNDVLLCNWRVGGLHGSC